MESANITLGTTSVLQAWPVPSMASFHEFTPPLRTESCRFQACQLTVLLLFLLHVAWSLSRGVEHSCQGLLSPA